MTRPASGEGGILEHVTRDVAIEALPTDIPDEITVDVSAMIVGDTIQLDTVTAPEGVTFLYDHLDEVTIATLNPPRVEEEPEVEQETEVIGEEAEGGEDSEGGEDDAESSDGGDDGDEG